MVDGRDVAEVPADDRGLAYGDGLFETMAVRDGRIEFRDLHLERLEEGCRRLGIASPGADLLRTELREVVGAAKSGSVKLIVTRGSGPRGYAPPVGADPRRILIREDAFPPRLPEAGARVRYCALRMGRNPAFAGLKTLNRLEQVRARAEWTDPGIHEGLMLNDRDDVIAGTMSNVFAVAEGRLITPRLDECGINGIMRGQIKALAKASGIDVQEERCGQAVFADAAEVFVTNSLIGIWPVAELGGVRYGPRPVTEALASRLEDVRAAGAQA